MELRNVKKIAPQITDEEFKTYILIKHCVYDNPYIPHEPTNKQLDFLKDLKTEEVLYGGAAGGGKSDAILMAALMFVDVPEYNALILRKTYKDLALPGAIMDRAMEWLSPHSELHWSDKEKKWEFPSGATLSFGYIFGPNDKYQYQSANFNFIAFDELTQFRESDYVYLMSRLRRGATTNIPSRIRSASNPGGRGHDWVKARFIEGEFKFIPAKLYDNPYLDTETYKETLLKLDPVTREQLLNGNWDVAVVGNMFKPHWFDIIDDIPHCNRRVRFWDLAATADTGTNNPDYCSGLLLGRNTENEFVVLDLVRFRADPGETQSRIVHTAKLDGIGADIVIEQEGGAAAKLYIDLLRKQVLGGKYHVVASKPDASKVVRAQAVSAACSRGEISLTRGVWNNDFLSELTRFPESEHDDICLVGETKIQTPNGVKMLKDVKIGDYVLSSTGYERIINHKLTSDNASTCTLTLNNGVSIVGTGNHLIYTNSGLKRLDSITREDFVWYYQKKSNSMELRIGSKLENILIKYDHLQRNGTPAQKGTNGMSNTQKKLQKTLKKIKSVFALNVGKNFSHIIGIQNIVLICAAIDIGEQKEAPSLKKHMLSAIQNLKHINNQTEKPVPKPVQVSTVEINAETRGVYDVTVNNSHNFFANGILVHNCDSFSGAYNYMVRRSGIDKDRIPKRTARIPSGGLS